MHTRWTVVGLVALIAGVFLGSAGCPSLNGLLCGQTGTGTLKVLVTDKPFPFDLIASARVTITSVAVRVADETSADATDQDTENAGGGSAKAIATAQDNTGDASETFITISTGEKEFDLLDLQGGRTDLLADTQIPAGTYDQMRLVVTGGTVVLKDGREFALKVPSGDESGIKLHFEFTVADGQQTTLLLDVDLSRAFQPIPGGHITDPSTIREFKFAPSLAMRLINVLQAGSIAGTVKDAAGNVVASASVTALKDGTEVTTTTTGADGTYVLGGLPTGTYRVEVSATGFQDAAVDNVAVTAGQQTAGVDFALTSQ
jgi:hypothetical protein